MLNKWQQSIEGGAITANEEAGRDLGSSWSQSRKSNVHWYEISKNTRNKCIYYVTRVEAKRRANLQKDILSKHEIRIQLKLINPREKNVPNLAWHLCLKIFLFMFHILIVLSDFSYKFSCFYLKIYFVEG